MTLSDAIAQYKAKLISSTTLLYYYLKIKLAPGWKMTLHQRPICKELGISKAAFYKGIQRLKDKNLIDWEAPNGLVVSFEQIGDSLDKLETPVDKLETIRQIGDSLDKLETIRQIGDSLDKLETIRQIGDSLDRSETPVDRSETPVDRSETLTLPKPSYSNSSGNPPDSYQIFINSLSNSQREKFFEFGLKKAAELPKPPTLPEKWLEKHYLELYEQFKKTPEGKKFATTQDWTNHPRRDEWIEQIRLGKPRFIAQGGPAEEREMRRQFADWAETNNLVWGTES